MNPWWLLLIIPVSAMTGFVFAAILTVGKRNEEDSE